MDTTCNEYTLGFVSDTSKPVSKSWIEASASFFVKIVISILVKYDSFPNDLGSYRTICEGIITADAGVSLHSPTSAALTAKIAI
jgi:hypothetical protein